MDRESSDCVEMWKVPNTQQMIILSCVSKILWIYLTSPVTFQLESVCKGGTRLKLVTDQSRDANCSTYPKWP